MNLRLFVVLVCILVGCNRIKVERFDPAVEARKLGLKVVDGPPGYYAAPDGSILSMTVLEHFSIQIEPSKWDDARPLVRLAAKLHGIPYELLHEPLEDAFSQPDGWKGDFPFDGLTLEISRIADGEYDMIDAVFNLDRDEFNR